MSRLIDADKFLERINRVFPCKDRDDTNIRRAVENGLRGCPTVNAIVIPDGATNGDMMVKLFPNLKYFVTQNDRLVTNIGCGSSFDREWWNAPFQKEVEE